MKTDERPRWNPHEDGNEWMLEAEHCAQPEPAWQEPLVRALWLIIAIALVGVGYYFWWPALMGGVGFIALYVGLRASERQENTCADD